MPPTKDGATDGSGVPKANIGTSGLTPVSVSNQGNVQALSKCRITKIVEGLYGIHLGSTNTFLLDSGDSCALIDTGFPGSGPTILEAVREIGKKPSDIRHILLTHAHVDHIGSYATLKRTTNASGYVHPVDAAIVEAGSGFRPMSPSPGLVPGLMFQMFTRPAESVEPARAEYHVNDGDRLPIAGGLKAIHIPGHCLGQLAFLWPYHGGVLFAADACMNVLSLSCSMGHENAEEGERSLRKLSLLTFRIACFGHGKTILHNASEQFKKTWGLQGSSLIYLR
jgi:glyoxylase-like metal-dependent hydrolase (beta-lactamase superfamily II)